MSTPNPLIPQGSLQHKAGRANSNVRIAVATIVAIHVVFFGGLLLQGCKRQTQVAEAPAEETNDPIPSYTYPPLTNTQSSLYYPSGDSLPSEQTNYEASPLPPVSSQASASVSRRTETSDAFSPSTNQRGIQTGMQATSPAFGTESPSAGPMREYTVVRGDSFYKIARAHNTTTRAITEANPNIDPARLQIGAKIKIPPAETSSTAASSGSSGAPASNGNVYTVKSGDTLTRIAQQHGTTVSALRAANGLRTSRLLVGQKLTIPSNGTNGNGGSTAPRF